MATEERFKTGEIIIVKWYETGDNQDNSVYKNKKTNKQNKRNIHYLKERDEWKFKTI